MRKFSPLAVQSLLPQWPAQLRCSLLPHFLYIYRSLNDTRVDRAIRVCPRYSIRPLNPNGTELLRDAPTVSHDCRPIFYIHTHTFEMSSDCGHQIKRTFNRGRLAIFAIRVQPVYGWQYVILDFHTRQTWTKGISVLFSALCVVKCPWWHMQMVLCHPCGCKKATDGLIIHLEMVVGLYIQMGTLYACCMILVVVCGETF